MNNMSLIPDVSASVEEDKLFSSDRLETLRGLSPELTDDEFNKVIDIYTKLEYSPNDFQHEAITHRGSPLRIIAIAGSGKTTTVLIKGIVKSIVFGVPSSDMYYITYSKYGSMDMKTKYDELLNKLGYVGRANFSTFHAFYLKILKTVNTSIKIISPIERLQVLRAAANRTLRIVSSETMNSLETLITFQTGNCLSESDMEKAGLFKEHKIEKREYSSIMFDYKLYKMEAHVVDFDDLQVEMLSLLENKPDVLEAVRTNWSTWFIDEYQDSSLIQATIGDLIAGDMKNLTVVGDDDQNIYRWRGSDNRLLLDFNIRNRGTKTIILPINYRVPKDVLSCIAPMIENNTERLPKEMVAYKEGGTINLIATPNSLMTSAYVQEQALLAARGDYIRDLNKIAIIHRKRDQAVIVIDSLLDNDIPVKVADINNTIYNSLIISDTMAVIAMALAPHDKTKFNRIAKKFFNYVSGKEIKMVYNRMNTVECWYDFIDRLPQRSRENMENEIHNLEMIAHYSSAGQPLEKALELIFPNLLSYMEYASKYVNIDVAEQTAFFEYIKFMARTRNWDYNNLINYIHNAQQKLKKYGKFESAVNVLTYHRAKGLEFSRTFVLGLTDQSCPSEKIIERKRGNGVPEEEIARYIEDERRAAYVALTRTDDRVDVVYEVGSESLFVKELANYGSATLSVNVNKNKRLVC